MFEEIWDAIVEGFAYIFSFEWVGDFIEGIGTAFEGLSELSITGIVLGLIGSGTIFMAREYMLTPFLIHMGPAESVFWGIATYAGTFAAGYLVGKHFDNT